MPAIGLSCCGVPAVPLLQFKGTVSRYCACTKRWFWTGCPEIKRWEESKRTLKNPFASHLAEFDTTLKLFRITDQWYIVPVEFRFRWNRDVFGDTFIAVGRRTKRWEALLIVKGIRRNETATIDTVRKKPLRRRRGCEWGDLVKLSFVKQTVLQRRVSKLLIELPYGRQNQTNRGYMFRKKVQWNDNIQFWLTFAIIHRVEIAFLFISFKRLRLEREQIRQILLDVNQLTSDTSFTLEKVFLKGAERDFRVARRPC